MRKPLMADFSHHNDLPKDWPSILLKHGVVAVMLKATEGTGFVDKTYKTRVEAAKAAGLCVGAYHYLRANAGVKQADHFLRTTGAASDPDLAVCCDWEVNDQTQEEATLETCEAFVRTLMAACPDRRPMLYFNNLRLTSKKVSKTSLIAKCVAWPSRYGPKLGKVAPPFSGYGFWQYTGDGLGDEPHTLPGLKGVCDLNVFYSGDADEVRRRWPFRPS